MADRFAREVGHPKRQCAGACGNPLKIEVAAELRKQTAVSMGWIANELNAGAAKSFWHALRERRKKYVDTWDWPFFFPIFENVFSFPHR